MRGGSRRRPSNEDLISELPKDVLVSILELMPIKDAVKTSALSKKWRYNWVSIKKLIFDVDFFVDFHRGFSAYFEIIHHTLLNHNGALDKFSLYLPYADDSVFSNTVCLFNCLNLVSRKGVKSFTIMLSCALLGKGEISNRVLTPLYTCVELTRLKMEQCVFSRNPAFRGFPNLIKLKVKILDFRGDSFEFLMSSCPLLEHLAMEDCTGPAVINICSVSLKHLKVVSGIRVVINAENLETLSFSPFGSNYTVGSVRIVSTANLLKKVAIELRGLEYSDDISMLLRLIHRAPNLQELEIILRNLQELKTMAITSGNHNEEGVTEILKSNLNQMLDKLRFIKLRLAKVARVELFLIERLLALSPSLENMVVELPLTRDIDGPKIRDKLMGFHRVSPKAQVAINPFITGSTCPLDIWEQLCLLD